MRSLPGRVLALLCLILVAYLAVGSLYAVKVPIWNAPDEPSHFNYVRHLAETRQLPVLQVGDYDQALLERLKATRFPRSESIDSIGYESHQPPLYYALASLVYTAIGGQPLETRAVALRMFSLALGAAALVVAFAISRRLFPKDHTLALGVVALIAFLPMRMAIYASVNNDVLAELVTSMVLLSLVAHWGRPWSRRQLALLGLLLGAALLTKVIAYVLVLLVPFGLLLSEKLRLQAEPRTIEKMLSGRLAKLVAQHTIIVYAFAGLLSGWWFARNLLTYGWPDAFGLIRHDAVVIGQATTGPLTLGVLRQFAAVFFQSFWGQFGWMGVPMDDRVYTALGMLSALAGLGLVLILLTRRSRPAATPRGYGGMLVLMGATVVLVFALVVQYNLKYVQAQGRYLFPAMVPIAAFLVLGWGEVLSERHRALLLGGLLAGLCSLDLVALYRFILPALGT